MVGVRPNDSGFCDRWFVRIDYLKPPDEEVVATGYLTPSGYVRSRKLCMTWPEVRLAVMRMRTDEASAYTRILIEQE